MDDLIQRQAVLALPRNRTRNMQGEIVEETINVAYIEQLPSAQPERHGRWLMEEKDSIYGKKYILTCSECGDVYSVSEDALPYEKYCRNCGSRNRR